MPRKPKVDLSGVVATVSRAKGKGGNGKRQSIKSPKQYRIPEVLTDDEIKASQPDSRHFAKGAQWCRARSSYGANPKYGTPEQIIDAAYQYFDYLATHPLIEVKLFQFKGQIVHGQSAKMHIPTLTGLHIFMGITASTWRNYRESDHLKDACEFVDNLIWQAKISGAAADLLNPMIVAREMGLKEYHVGEVSHTASKELSESILSILNAIYKPSSST